MGAVGYLDCHFRRLDLVELFCEDEYCRKGLISYLEDCKDLERSVQKVFIRTKLVRVKLIYCYFRGVYYFHETDENVVAKCVHEGHNNFQGGKTILEWGEGEEECPLKSLKIPVYIICILFCHIF